MYGEKSYFFYKGAFQLTLLYILPFIVFAVSFQLFAMSFFPALLSIPYIAASIYIGFPRIRAAVSLRYYQKERFDKALEIAKKCMRNRFCPEGIKVFYAHLLLLKGKYVLAEEILNQVNVQKLSYSENAKNLANRALILWKTAGIQEGLECIESHRCKGSDEGIYYAAGKMLNSAGDALEARKYSEEAAEYYTFHRGIGRNLCYAYFHTRQYDMFAQKYLEIRRDLGGLDGDLLYLMSNRRQKEGRTEDARALLQEALKREELSIDLVSRVQIEEMLSRLESTVRG